MGAIPFLSIQKRLANNTVSKMLDKKTNKAIILAIITTALSRIYGLSNGDAATLGGSILAIVQIYFSINNWYHSITTNLSTLKSDISKLEERVNGLSNRSTEEPENTNTIDNDQVNKVSIAINNYGGVSTDVDEKASSDNESKTIDTPAIVNLK